MLRTLFAIAVAGLIFAAMSGNTQAAPAAPLPAVAMADVNILTLGVAVGATVGAACTAVAAGVTVGAAYVAGDFTRSRRQKADVMSADRDVRYCPESGHWATMSALCQ